MKVIDLWGYMETAKRYAEELTKNLDVILSIMGFGLGLFIISLYYIINLNND